MRKLKWESVGTGKKQRKGGSFRNCLKPFAEYVFGDEMEQVWPGLHLTGEKILEESDLKILS